MHLPKLMAACFYLVHATAIPTDETAVNNITSDEGMELDKQWDAYGLDTTSDETNDTTNDLEKRSDDDVTDTNDLEKRYRKKSDTKAGTPPNGNKWKLGSWWGDNF
jgi:hypothetical protein